MLSTFCDIPHVWEAVDRGHVYQLGKRIALTKPDTASVSGGGRNGTCATDPSKIPASAPA